MQSQGSIENPSYRELLRTRYRKRHLLRNSLTSVALVFFATAAALAVVAPPDTPIIYQAQQKLPLPESFLEPLGSTEADTSPYISEIRIRRGDTLAALLQRLNVQEPGLQQFLVQAPEARSIYKLYPGRSVQAAHDIDNKLVWLRYNHTPGTNADGDQVAKWLEITPDSEGGFTAAEHVKANDTTIRVAEGTIESSLFGATDKAGIPDSVTLQMAEILSSKIDFMRDLRRGDRFHIIYEAHAHQGRDAGAGRILALEFIGQKKTYEAVWFAPESGSGSYYDFSGSSLQGAFLRTALKFTRISSTFGMRKHPIHNSWRGHNGVDYAASAGTPIHATSDGSVEFIGTQKGYGNTIILKHHNNYTTLYAHQQRFAKGLKKGDKVSQGQLIGYVGSTGWATGPHLHYEFRVNNKPIDPLSVDLPVARTLEKSDRKAFEQVMAQYRQPLQMLADLRLSKDIETDDSTTLASR